MEWFFSAALVAAGTTLFGHFEEGVLRCRRLPGWAAYLGTVAGLSETAGRPWTFAPSG